MSRRLLKPQRPKGTTAPGKPAPCVSRASPDPGPRPSTRRTVRPPRGPGAGGTRRQPSPARPAVADYGISPTTSRCGLPEPRHCIGKPGRPVHNPQPDIAGFAPQRSGPPRPAPALDTGRFQPPGSQGAPGPQGISPGTPAPDPFFNLDTTRRTLATPAPAGAIASRPGCTRRTRATKSRPLLDTRAPPFRERPSWPSA